MYFSLGTFPALNCNADIYSLANNKRIPYYT